MERKKREILRKRMQGLIKKSNELAIRTGVNVSLRVFNPHNGKTYVYDSTLEGQMLPQNNESNSLQYYSDIANNAY